MVCWADGLATGEGLSLQIQIFFCKILPWLMKKCLSNIRNLNHFKTFPSPPMPQAHSVRITQRGNMGFSSSNRWMSTRISQIYCRPRAREQRWSERRKKHPPSPLVSTKPSATMPSTSAAMVTVTKTSTVNAPSIPALTAPVWPPLRCPSIHTASGRQRHSEKLSEHFLSQPLSRASR